MEQVQSDHKSWPKPKRPILLVIAILFITVGTIICLLNIVQILRGPWTAILDVLFSACGLIMALMQWQPLARPSSHPASPPTPHTHITTTNLGVDNYRGAVIIHVKRQDRGQGIHLSRGFNSSQNPPNAAATIMQHTIDGHRTYAALFPSVEPGNYTVSRPHQQHVNITVYPGQTTIIDWH